MSLERETKICKHTLPQVRLTGEDDKESAKVMKFFWMILPLFANYRNYFFFFFLYTLTLIDRVC